MSTQRLAIIGAGPSGMAVLSALESAKQKIGCNFPEIICFEKQGDLGGLWNYNWRTGVDDYGQPVHGSMYHDLWCNAPKECQEMADYSFEQHFGRAIPSYMPRAVVRDYLEGRAKRDQIRKYIRFNSPVVWIDDKSGEFEVTVKDLTEGKIHVQLFDYVIVATGHFSFPHLPNFHGFDIFPGRILHSHDFRNAKEFAGQNVLVIGNSYSAEDIGLQCYKFGAKSVTLSFHTKPLTYNWPDSFSVVPFLQRVEANKLAHFGDKTSKEVDSIILCTGYNHHFPFLPDSLRLKTKNLLYPDFLYKGLFWVDNPKLIYIGMQNQFFTFPMFDAQAYYIREVITGQRPKSHLSTKNEILADIQQWRSRENALTSLSAAIDFQVDYVQDLLDAIGYPSAFFKGAAEILKTWDTHKVENILTFRDRSYRSIVTGNQAPFYSKPWMKSFEDSLEAFMDNVDKSDIE